MDGLFIGWPAIPHEGAAHGADIAHLPYRASSAIKNQFNSENGSR